MSPPAALKPIVAWFCLNAATGILLLVPFPHRWYFLPAILIPATISYRTIQYLSFPPGLSELWGTISFIGLIHFSSLLYIKKWGLRITPDSNRVSKLEVKWLDRRLWIRMYKVATNPRLIRVSYKDIVLPNQVARSTGEVKSPTKHKKFVKTKVLWLLVRIGACAAVSRWATSRLLGIITVNDFAPVKSIILRRLFRSNIFSSSDRVSTREIIMRIWFTMNSIYAPILLLDCIHTSLATIFIHLVRVDTPDDWPDLFGSHLEAFTLGRFWSRYIHIPFSDVERTANEIQDSGIVFMFPVTVTMPMF